MVLERRMRLGGVEGGLYRRRRSFQPLWRADKWRDDASQEGLVKGNIKGGDDVSYGGPMKGK